MPNIPFTWTPLAGLPDDGPVTDLAIAPIVGGPGAVVTFKQADQMRLLWVYGTTVKVLDTDLYEQDGFKDAAGAVWLAADGKLYALVSHAFLGVGSSSRLTLGVADAPWAASAFSLLDQRIDARATAIVTAALQGGEDTSDLHALISALTVRVGALEKVYQDLSALVGRVVSVLRGI